MTALLYRGAGGSILVADSAVPVQTTPILFYCTCWPERLHLCPRSRNDVARLEMEPEMTQRVKSRCYARKSVSKKA